MRPPLWLIVGIAACAPSPATPDDGTQGSCGAAQFVLCEAHDECGNKCYERAAEACDELACDHGCHLYPGPSKRVLCAPIDHYGDMSKCGGMGGWICPENTTCQMPEMPENTGMDDAMGDCVPDK